MANDEHVEIVKQGAEAIAAWREAHSHLHLQLMDADLEDADLEDADLQGANLRRANLRRANLENAILKSANLRQANLRRANLQGADLQATYLVSADLREASCESANFENAFLSYIHLQGAYLHDADLQNAILESADLQNAILDSADLRNAFLLGTHLRGAYLHDANLQRAWLQGACLEGALLTGADLRYAKLQYAKLRGAYLQGSTLQDADLKGADLLGSHLLGAKLKGAKLYAARLDHYTQIDNKWRLIWQIVNGNAPRNNLTKEDLSGAYLAHAELNNFDLTGANLRGVNLSGAKINGTVFDDIQVDQETIEKTAPVIPELLQAFVDRLSLDEGLYRIIREIEFPPEYKQAGIGIMNYFAEVIKQKYPDIPATVQITQDDLTVRMTIETDDGHRETVEQALNDYGLVVAGQRQPAEFLEDRVAVMRLENKLTMVEAELQQERRAYGLLEGQKEISDRLLRWAERYADRQDQDIEHLQTEVSELRQILGNSLTGAQEATYRAQETNHLLAAGAIIYNQNLAALFDRHLASAPDSETLRQAMSAIQTLAERAVAAENEAGLSNQERAKLTQAAADIQAESGTYWSVFKGELIEFFKGAGAGVGGNYATDAVKDFIEISA